jgi:hypothetical protein
MEIIYPHPDDWMYEDTESPLQEMSRPLKFVQDDLRKYEGAMFTHLLKIFYFRDDTRYLRGWIITVHKCVFQTFKVKAPKGKKDYRLSTEDIYEILWGSRVDVFPEHHDGMLKDFNTKSNPEYSDLPYIHKGGNVEQAEAFLKGYYIWLAKNLSTKERITFDDVKDEIMTLLKKYPVS